MYLVNIVVALAFLAAGVVNAIGPAPIRSEFEKWGYPAWLRLIVAAVEFGGAICMMLAETHRFGAVTLLIIVLGVLVSFIRSREWMRMQYPLMLLLLLIILFMQPGA
ncbi:hypothetical protein AWB71_00448 [Caballeronia peredens]|nr:hypothetical protein AWB71_00448 [Caballeronia peredens]